MNRLVILALTALPVGVGGGLAGGDASKNVEVVGVQVQKEIPGINSPSGNSLEAETSVTLLVKQPGKHVVGLDVEASKIISFTDDKKTDLKKEASKATLGPGGELEFKFSSRGPVGFLPDQFKGGDRIMVQLRTGNPPARGATKLQVKAALALKIAKAEKVEKKNLNAESEVKFGDVGATLSKDKCEGRPLVSVAYPSNILKSIEFFDKDGKAIPSRLVGSFIGGGSHEASYFQQFALESKDDPLTVRVTYFDKWETITVQVDVEAGLGL